MGGINCSNCHKCFTKINLYIVCFFFFGFWFHCLLMEDYSFLFLKHVSFCLEIVSTFRCLLFYRQTNIPIDFGINRRFSIDL